MVVAALTLGGCLWSDLESRVYSCTTSEQCADGFHCDVPKSVCVRDGSSGGGAGGGGGSAGGSGGGVAGGSGGGGDDAGLDAGLDAGDDGGIDAGTDAGRDAGTDAGTDAGFDAGFDAGGVIGASCGQPSDCQNNRCVDGRCCNSTCSGVCDFCDLPSQPGQCGAGPLGRSPSTACAGGYACNGVSANCPTTCALDAGGCVGARCGAGGACLAKTSTLKEDFNSGGFDASVWGSISANCTVINQQLHVVTTPATTNYYGIDSKRRFDFLDSELRFELVDAGDQSLNSMQAFTSVCNYPNGNRCLTFIVSGGNAFIQLSDNGSYPLVAGYYPISARRTYRMRETAGTTYIENLSDAGTWQQLGSAATPLRFEFNDVFVTMGSGTYQPEATASTVVWDNLNTP